MADRSEQSENLESYKCRSDCVGNLHQNNSRQLQDEESLDILLTVLESASF
jgi:hypothetical protein